MYCPWLITLLLAGQGFTATDAYEGRFFSGRGDVQYLQMLDTARRMFEPDPQYQNLAMLYTPAWNGLVEGPTWDAWWIQNSYGTTYAALPFLVEPYTTFLQNSQDLWFDQMGDGHTPRPFEQHRGKRFDWVPPDGCLCDAARPGWVVAKQGDGRVDLHDWALEFTAAGVVMQAELLLVARDHQAIARYLPLLERCTAFIETRRDPSNDLFLAGPAANLLAPSYAGYLKPDGTYGQAYLTGLSVTHIAALDRLIELEKMLGRNDRADHYADLRNRARRGLDALTTPEGYFIRSLDPNGTRHGVYGAEQHGYFESAPNHDAICFNVVDDAQARRIYDTIASIPGLRPHAFIIANCPGYDDLYTEPTGLWEFGRWVNGGHWSTCEARMILGYYRLGAFDDARRSMQQILRLARDFRLDNPLTEFGFAVYQPHQPINLCYDTLGPPAAMIRGLFEYRYQADRLLLLPHIPPSITQLQQKFPIRFGPKRLYLATAGRGPIRKVLINSRPWPEFTETTVTLPFHRTPHEANILIQLGDEPPAIPPTFDGIAPRTPTLPAADELPATFAALYPTLDAMKKSLEGIDRSAWPAHAAVSHGELVLDAAQAAARRHALLQVSQLDRLPEPDRQTAADAAYLQTVDRLATGWIKLVEDHADTDDSILKSLRQAWADQKR